MSIAFAPWARPNGASVLLPCPAVSGTNSSGRSFFGFWRVCCSRRLARWGLAGFAVLPAPSPASPDCCDRLVFSCLRCFRAHRYSSNFRRASSVPELGLVLVPSSSLRPCVGAGTFGVFPRRCSLCVFVVLEVSDRCLFSLLGTSSGLARFRPPCRGEACPEVSILFLVVFLCLRWSLLYLLGFLVSGGIF